MNPEALGALREPERVNGYRVKWYPVPAEDRCMTWTIRSEDGITILRDVEPEVAEYIADLHNDALEA